jgi:predicted O-methyltransferase YrrM
MDSGLLFTKLIKDKRSSMRYLQNLTGIILDKLWRIKIARNIDRKQFVCQIIRNEKPHSILEIGTRNGTLAKKNVVNVPRIRS